MAPGKPVVARPLVGRDATMLACMAGWMDAHLGARRMRAV